MSGGGGGGCESTSQRVAPTRRTTNINSPAQLAVTRDQQIASDKFASTRSHELRYLECVPDDRDGFRTRGSRSPLSARAQLSGARSRRQPVGPDQVNYYCNQSFHLRELPHAQPQAARVPVQQQQQPHALRPSGSLESFCDTSLENNTLTDTSHCARQDVLPGLGSSQRRSQYPRYSELPSPSADLGHHTMRAPASTLYCLPAATALSEQQPADRHAGALIKASLRHPNQTANYRHQSSRDSNMSCGPGAQKTALRVHAGAGQGPIPPPPPPQDCCPSVSSATTSSAAPSLAQQPAHQQQPLVASNSSLPPPQPPSTSNVPQPAQVWPPSPHHQLNCGLQYQALHQQQQPPLVDDCTSDQELSDCSCSNSIECLTLSQHSGALTMAGGQLAPHPPPQHHLNQHHRHPMHHQMQHHAAPVHGYGHYEANEHHLRMHHSNRQHPPGTPLSLPHASLPAPPPPPAPPPLVRHNTYSATSDTITDATLLSSSQQPMVASQQHGGSLAPGNFGASSSQAKGESSSRQHRKIEHQDLRTSSADVSVDANQHSKQARQTVSFRRSATSTSGAANEPPPAGERPLQVYAQSVKLHRSGNSSYFRQQSSSQRHSPSANAGATMQRPNSAASQQQYQQQQLASNFVIPPTVTYSPFSPHPGSGSLPLVRASGGARTATGASSALPIQFDSSVCPPLPPITSHRTNSPWMRISSIILTPIGMVIILFIVVSPLLHYLM